MLYWALLTCSSTFVKFDHDGLCSSAAQLAGLVSAAGGFRGIRDKSPGV